MSITAGNATDLYLQVLRHVLLRGSMRSPRGRDTLELIGSHLILTNPYRNIIVIPERKLSYHFMVAEWLWMMEGSNRLDLIQPFNNRIGDFSDDGQTLTGAYGPKLAEQLPYVIRTLREDPSSRQAVLTLWRERPGISKDIPCTIMFQFFLRQSGDGAKVLDMIAYMRSNDAWWGLPYDLFTFTMIQQHVASELDAICGNYHHMVGSLHLYDEFIAKADKIVKQGDETPMHQVQDHVTNHMMPLPPISTELRSVFVGLALMAKHADTASDIKLWCNELISVHPWREMLSLLAHRFHKDNNLLLSPWRELVLGHG